MSNVKAKIQNGVRLSTKMRLGEGEEATTADPSFLSYLALFGSVFMGKSQ